MDRRSFLRGLGLVVAGVAIEQAIPLGRVWSFPSKIALGTTRNFRIPMRYGLVPIACDFDLAPDMLYLHPVQAREYLKLIGE